MSLPASTPSASWVFRAIRHGLLLALCLSSFWGGAFGQFHVVEATEETETTASVDSWDAAETDTPGEGAGGDKVLTYAFFSVGMTAAMLLLGLVLMRVVQAQRKELTHAPRRPERVTEEQFEKQVMRTMGIGSNAQPAQAPPPDDSAPRSEKADERPSQTPQSPERAGMAAAVLSAVERMQTARLIGNEPSMPVGSEIPGGCIVRLRSGKRVLVAPCDTPLERVFAMTKLCDFVVLARDDGSAILCRSLAEFIAESVFPGG